MRCQICYGISVLSRGGRDMKEISCAHEALSCKDMHVTKNHGVSRLKGVRPQFELALYRAGNNDNVTKNGGGRGRISGE
jgi:hypothetical protein